MPESHTRHRLLPASNSTKEDLQEIYASAEASYQNTRLLAEYIPELSDKLIELRLLMEEYQRNNSSSHEDHEEQLNEIIEFCNSISDSFGKLVEALTNNIQYTSEENKKIRNILLSLATNYKNMQAAIIGIKSSLESNLTKQQQDELHIKQVAVKIDEIYAHLTKSIRFLKNINDDDIITFLPRLNIVIDELLQEKGYDSDGKKKERINLFFETIWNHMKFNIINMLIAALLIWILNNYSVNHNNQVNSKPTYEQNQNNDNKDKPLQDTQPTNKQ